MFRPLAAFAFLSAALATSPASACGGVGAACEVSGGVYHAATPGGAGPHPALIFLHGFGGTGEGVIRNKGLVNAILARGYAVVAPQGLPWREGQRGGAWNSMKREARRDDVAFLNDVAAAAADRHGLDRSRMLIAGFSGGGMMTWRVACDAPKS
ncbi:MAG: PHB depolymerase family esterase, partial [Pseudomonadota bacterium]